MIMVHTSGPPPFLKGEEVNFDYLPWSGEIWKILKSRWKYGAEAGLLKVGGRGVGTFFIYFFQGLSFFHLEITLCKILLCI